MWWKAKIHKVQTGVSKRQPVIYVIHLGSHLLILSLLSICFLGCCHSLSPFRMSRTSVMVDSLLDSRRPYRKPPFYLSPRPQPESRVHLLHLRCRREPIGIFTRHIFLANRSSSDYAEHKQSNTFSWPFESPLGHKGTNGKLLLLRQAFDRDPLQLTLKLIMRAKAVNISIRH